MVVRSCGGNVCQCSSSDDVETLSEATHSSCASPDEAEVSREATPISDVNVEGGTAASNPGSTIQSEHNDDDDDEMCTCSDAEPNVSPVDTCATRPPPPAHSIASPAPLSLDIPHNFPRARITRPAPTHAPPPAPVANLKGFWRVWGYTAQRSEILVYHPHTHTPITKLRARRFEPAKRPLADSSLTYDSSGMRQIRTDAYVRYGAHAVMQPGSPNRPNTQTQPPESLTTNSTSDGFWSFLRMRAARDDEANPTMPSTRRNMDGIELSRHRSVALPCPPSRNR